MLQDNRRIFSENFIKFFKIRKKIIWLDIIYILYVKNSNRQLKE